MAKAKKAVKKSGSGNPTLKNNSVPWVEPFPEAKMTEDKDGQLLDAVMVRAIPKQDIRINGHLLPMGREVTLPCSVAHAHAAALGGPKE